MQVCMLPNQQGRGLIQVARAGSEVSIKGHIETLRE
jgi:hypothetical protein